MPKSLSAPPRPLAPGDVVATFCDALGEWSAAQVTGLNPEWRCAGVLELEWSGPEPSSLEDIGDLVPLRLSHHAHTSALSHCNFEWLLPKTYKVLGNAPLVHDGASNIYSSGWKVGEQLARQRRWDDQGLDSKDPGDLELSSSELQSLLRESERPSNAWCLRVTDIESLDCRALAAAFPNLSWLSLEGALGELQNASAINDLVRLRSLFITDLFGMPATDIPVVTALPSMEMLCLHSIPADFARAARQHWAPEVRHGVYVEITGARRPDWLDENRSNPLRDWDGRHHISAARYGKSVAQYKTTRQELLSELSRSTAPVDTARFHSIGRDYADAFNKIDGTRSPFIETEEREDLICALTALIEEAEAQTGRRHPEAMQALLDGIESVRTW